jgi:hypothetical protein
VSTHFRPLLAARACFDERDVNEAHGLGQNAIEEWEKSIAGEMLQQFSERFAQREHFSEIGGSEIGPDVPGVYAFAADLDHTDDFVGGKNRCADYFLNGLGGVGARFHTFEDCRMRRGAKSIVDFGATLAGGASSKSRIACEGNEPHILERFGNQKVQVAPARRQSENADLAGFHAEIFRDAFGDGGPRNRAFAFGSFTQAIGEAL